MSLRENIIACEKNILGTIIRDNNYMVKALFTLSEDDFLSGANRLIFKGMNELYSNSIPFDLEVLINKLMQFIKKGALSITYVTEVSTHCVPSSFQSNLEIVKENSNERKLYEAFYKVKNSDDSIEKKMEYVQNVLASINRVREENKIYSMEEMLDASLKRAEEIRNSESGYAGFITGLKSVDEASNGFERKKFTIIGARPSMGKTTFSLELLERLNGKILYIQLDMSVSGMGSRILARNTNLENGKISRGRLNEEEEKRVKNVYERLKSEKDITIYEPDSITMPQIRLLAKEIQIKKGGLDIIIIDHVGMIRPVTQGSVYEKKTEISHGLKSLAKELNVAMIGLCQLNRGAEQRGDKRPLLGDLRDTGSFEEDADIIMLLFRKGYYKPREDKKNLKEDVLEVNFAKCRDGRTGIIKLKYNLETQRLFELNEK